MLEFVLTTRKYDL